jgi:hypothetical protein
LKNFAHIQVAQKRGAKKDLEGDPAEKPPECKGYIPLKLERFFGSLCPFSGKETTFPKECVTADDILCRVVTSSSAGMVWPCQD